MFARQQLWKHAFTAIPGLAVFDAKYEGRDPISAMAFERLGITLKDTYVAMDKDKKGNEVAVMMAATARVGRQACDEIVGDPQNRCRMSVGYASAVADTLNTMHIVTRVLPKYNVHVTVNMQAQISGGREILEGTDIAVISTIVKTGKQLCYCTTDIIHLPEEVTAETLEREAAIKNMTDLRAALQHYEQMYHNAHVKAFMPQGFFDS